MAEQDDFLDPPQVWYVWDGERLYLPYPGGNGAGSEEAAHRIVRANPSSGYQAVQMEVTFAEEGHECVWNYSHSEPTWGAHYECAICGAKTP